MRLDFGIVWGHGMKYIDGILDVLDKYKDLELIYFREYIPNDFDRFISEIYSLDTVPLEHLRAKNAYLNNIEKKVYIMLIKNKKPEPVIVGEGEFMHEQCMLINRFKWHVRELFNPVIDGERSEHHMIHCSDYPSQTDKFLSIYNMGSIYDWLFSKTPGQPLLPYHLEEIRDMTIKTIDGDDLMVNLFNEKKKKITVPIKKSPHYKYVAGDKGEYIKYWEGWKGKSLTEDHRPAKFDKLIDWFDMEKYREMFKYIIINDGIIVDGVHRASILLCRGQKLFPVLEIND